MARPRPYLVAVASRVERHKHELSRTIMSSLVPGSQEIACAPRTSPEDGLDWTPFRERCPAKAGKRCRAAGVGPAAAVRDSACRHADCGCDAQSAAALERRLGQRGGLRGGRWLGGGGTAYRGSSAKLPRCQTSSNSGRALQSRAVRPMKWPWWRVCEGRPSAMAARKTLNRLRTAADRLYQPRGPCHDSSGGAPPEVVGLGEGGECGGPRAARGPCARGSWQRDPTGSRARAFQELYKRTNLR